MANDDCASSDLGEISRLIRGVLGPAAPVYPVITQAVATIAMLNAELAIRTAELARALQERDTARRDRDDVAMRLLNLEETQI